MGYKATKGSKRPFRGIVIIGNFAQSSVVQELVHGRMTQAMRSEGLEPTNETSVARRPPKTIRKAQDRVNHIGGGLEWAENR